MVMSWQKEIFKFKHKSHTQHKPRHNLMPKEHAGTLTGQFVFSNRLLLCGGRKQRQHLKNKIKYIWYFRTKTSFVMNILQNKNLIRN